MLPQNNLITASAGGTPAAKDNRTNKIILYVGLLLLAISATLFAVYEKIAQGRSEALSVFGIHYLLAIAYVFILIFNRSYGIRRSWEHQNLDMTTLLLNLFLISAYALNRELQVFETSTNWLCAYIIVSSLTTLSLNYYHRLPKWVNHVQYLLLGGSMVLYLYLAIYVTQFYIIGGIGILAFGIGMHIFVPAALFTLGIFRIINTSGKSPANYFLLTAGALIPLVTASIFAIEWNSRIKDIETVSNQSVMYKETELPVWFTIAQSIPDDWISKRIIKSELVYTMHNNTGLWSFMPSTNWSEKREHDPLVFLSSMISTSNLSVEGRKKILVSVFSDRHRAQEKLWRGDDLITSYVVSDVDIFPALRLSYMEKYLSIRNNSQWSGSSQEAIYSFQLPEGAVVTSLSLWINGKEEKGILTSKQKASKAYHDIVGVERRDPSVVHWQEGNTVSVRVFPCGTNEERKFKIGITAPMAERNGKLVMENISFMGPNSYNARETYRIRFHGPADAIEVPSGFTRDRKGDYITEQSYNEKFEIAFTARPLPENHFSFDGNTYSLVPYTEQFAKFEAKKIFLDINSAWTMDELASCRYMLEVYAVYCYIDQEFIQLSIDNWDDVTRSATGYNFSLFPFHLIKEREHSLVVTKGRLQSPQLSDVKESAFAEGLKKFLGSEKKIKVFNLDGGTSTFIRSLRELRSFEFGSGTPGNLKNLLAADSFPISIETPDQVVLHDARIVVTKTKSAGTLPDTAPDHLARLFAYNDVMRKIGSSYFNDDFINNELIEEARTAYVVSPVSSLIVLESQEDYKRFGIEDKENSLHNASKESSGAVPEPHEWALIILFIGFVIYTSYSQLKKLRTI